MPSFSSFNEYEKWFNEHEANLQRTCELVERMISGALDEHKIQYLPIISRIKQRESVKEKLQVKARLKPYEVTDVIGLRVVVLLDHDIDAAFQVLSSLFELDLENCIDKRKQERIDSVGYRSLHIVASLGKGRQSLPEYKGLCGHKFEIQIRTALQHTWAEIEHKRNYKGKFALPTELQRRLMVLSGTLELIDSEFSRIAQEAEEYRKKLEGADGSTSSDELTYLAMKDIIDRAVEEIEEFATVAFKSESHEAIKGELERFGVTTIKDLKFMLETEKAKSIIKHLSKAYSVHAVGMLRDVMICTDIERYFKDSFRDSFGVMEIDDIDYLAKISGRNDILQVIESNGVDVIPF